MTTIALTNQQQHAVDSALDAISSKTPLFRIGGYAGTGKTTTLSHIVDTLGDSFCGVCAYAGKAANVLRQKGVNANTIHKTIYEFDEYSEQFHLIDSVPYRAFLIDEASMVGAEIFQDLQSFDIPIIAIGDPGQLPPVSKYDLNLMDERDITLKTIHRQAQDNPIIELATEVRHRGLPSSFSSEKANILSNKELWKDLDWADIILCGMNRTRCFINLEIRQSQGISDTILADGEPIICLKNDARKLGVFNGQMFTVDEVIDEDYNALLCNLTDSLGESQVQWVATTFLGSKNGPTFQESKPHWGRHIIADYGYCITTHKAQGSEWDKVAVVCEPCELWDQRRWDYTAITRAAEEVRVYV